MDVPVHSLPSAEQCIAISVLLPESSLERYSPFGLSSNCRQRCPILVARLFEELRFTCK
jgi:hypothetical protein